MNESNISKVGEEKPSQLQKITPCLWFDNQAEEAANFYITVFKNSKIDQVTLYGKEGYDIHGMKEGTAMTVDFEIESQKFVALNGGPVFKFNEAISFQVFCDTQKELDYYWEKLSEDGDKNAQQCGWLKDKYGVSWQICTYSFAQNDTRQRSNKITKGDESHASNAKARHTNFNSSL